MSAGKDRTQPSGLVPHPRFGDRVQPSGYVVSPEVIRGSFWRYEREAFFAESALPADLEQQTPSLYPRVYYVDLLRVCRDCGRYFLFFAREQQYWYEVLHFHLDADCVHCPECRARRHVARRRWQRYSERVNQPDLGPAALEELVSDALELFAEGRLREQTLRTLKNRALHSLPEAEVTRRIEELVARLGS